MEAQTDAITTPQMRHIYALARAGGLDSDALHAVVDGLTGKDSIKALTNRDARRVIDRLKRLTGQESTHAPDRPSTEQVGFLYALAGKLGWSEDPARLTAWLESRYGVSHPRFLTERSTHECLQAMKAMLAGGRGERKGGHRGKVDGPAEGQ